MNEFDDEQESDNSEEAWMMMQQLHWAWISHYTGQDLGVLTNKFEEWCNSQTIEELDDILGIEKAPENENLHSAEDIIKSMWKDGN